MAALRAVREFAAVTLITRGPIGRYNADRLRRAIELYAARPTRHEACDVLAAEYPAMSATDIERYYVAAGRCVVYDVRV